MGFTNDDDGGEMGGRSGQGALVLDDQGTLVLESGLLIDQLLRPRSIALEHMKRNLGRAAC